MKNMAHDRFIPVSLKLNRTDVDLILKFLNVYESCSFVFPFARKGIKNECIAQIRI